MMRGYFRIARTILVLTLGILTLGFGFAQPAQAREDDPNRVKTQWGGTLRAGGAFIYEDDLDNKFGGPMLNGQIFYNLGGRRGDIGSDWNMGLNVDYEHHELNHTKANLDVFTVMSFIEFRTRYDHWAPYMTSGVGINFNAVTNEQSSINVDVENSVAVKFGVGADWFITDHIAINTEGA